MDARPDRTILLPARMPKVVFRCCSLSEGAMETGSKGREWSLLFKSIVVIAGKVQCAL